MSQLENRQLLSAGTVISEIMFDLPSTDTPNEYIELRGTPNAVLSAGTYLVAVEGDNVSTKGSVQDIFDLSGLSIGANGYLVLLQKGEMYDVNPGSSVYTNAGTGAGWGHATTSSVGHRGQSAAIEIEDESVTFFLITTSSPPRVTATVPTSTTATDIDTDNDGFADGTAYTNWTILDSVGITSGTSTSSYGRITFRNGGSGTAPSNAPVVQTNFTAGYVARVGNSTGYLANDWVAGASFFSVTPDPGQPLQIYFHNSVITENIRTTPASLAGLEITDDIGALNTYSANIAPVIADLGGTVTYTTYGPMVSLSDAALVNDPDSVNFDTGTLTVAVTTNNDSFDRLQIRNQGTGSGQIGVAGSNVSFGGTTIGSFTGGVGTTPLVVTLNANATAAATQALVRNINYFTAFPAPINPTRTVSFTLTDGDGGSSGAVAKNVLIGLGTLNTPPAISPQTFSLDENSPNSTAVGTVVASDPEQPVQSISYAITAGNTGGAFAINSTTGQITVANTAALDFETTPSFSLTVTVTDDSTPTAASASATITINLNNANEAPTAVNLLNTVTSANETNAPLAVALKVADIQVVDDAIGSETLSLFGTDAEFFEIVGNELRIKQGTVFDFETKSSYAVTVRVDDATVGGTPDASTNFSFTLIDVTEDSVPPTASFVAVPAVRTTALGIVTMNFSEDVTGVTLSDLSLTRNGASISLAGLTVTQVTPAQYTIDLSTVTAVGGDYVLTLTAAGSGIIDGATNPLASNASLSWSNVQIAGFDVQNGQNQRSYVRYLTVQFAGTGGLSALLASGRVRLTRYDLNGANGVTAALGTLSVVGNELRVDFGVQGVGGNRLSTSYDGFYRLEIDRDGNGTFDAERTFHRLLGDFDGNRQVNDIDLAGVTAAMSGPYNATYDVDGNGVVNANDRTKVLVSARANRKLLDSLTVDD